MLTLIEEDKTVGKFCKTITVHDCLVDLGEHKFPIRIPECLSFWHKLLGNDFRPLYYRGANTTKYGLVPVFKNIEMLGAVLDEKNYQTFLKSFNRKQNTGKNKNTLKEKLNAVNGAWYLDNIIGEYFTKRQNLTWHELNDTHVQSHLERLESNGNRYLEGHQFGDTHNQRLHFAYGVINSIAATTELNWNIESNDDYGNWSELHGNYYPRLGCGHISEALAEAFVDAGGQLLVGTEIAECRSSEGHVKEVKLSSGETKRPNKIIVSDMAAAQKGILGIPLPELRYEEPPNIIFVVLIFGNDQKIPFTTIDVPEDDSVILRITPFSNWSEALTKGKNKTTVGFEIRDTVVSDLSEFSKKSNRQIADYCSDALQSWMGFTELIPEHSVVVRIPKKSPLEVNKIRQIPNVITLEATNLAGTTKDGLDILDRL